MRVAVVIAALIGAVACRPAPPSENEYVTVEREVSAIIAALELTEVTPAGPPFRRATFKMSEVCMCPSSQVLADSDRSIADIFTVTKQVLTERGFARQEVYAPEGEVLPDLGGVWGHKSSFRAIVSFRSGPTAGHVSVSIYVEHIRNFGPPPEP